MAFTDPFFLLAIGGLLLAHWAIVSLAESGGRAARLRVLALCVGSLALFASTGWLSLGLLLFVGVIAWALAEQRYIPALAVAVLVFGPLAAFKWLQSANIAQLPAVAGLLVLPGISFYTFQAWAYFQDRRQRVAPRARGPVEFFAFLSFSPQLVAGPIVVFNQIRRQLRAVPTLSARNASAGICRIMIGFGKKGLLADQLAGFADPCFAMISSCGSAELWAATAAYALQIYLDFSAYSDIALGFGLLFGLRLPKNFNNPYHASSVRDFWRRWHITLSTWLRDYIYIPLGGSRNGQFRAVFAVVCTMGLGGFWHGGAWGFVIWGLAHGIMIIIEQIVRPDHWKSALPRFLWRIISMIFVVLAWLPFRITAQPDGRGGLEATADALERMFSILSDRSVLASGAMPSGAELGLLFGATFAVAAGPVLLRIQARILRRSVPAALVAGAALASVALVVFSPEATPFLYFVF